MLTRRGGQRALPLPTGGVEYREKDDGTPFRLEWNTEKKDLFFRMWNVEKYCFDGMECGERRQSRLLFPGPTLRGDSTIKPSRPIETGHVRILLAVLSFWKNTTVEW